MPTEPVTLADLAGRLRSSRRPRIIGDPVTNVVDVHHDSRRVTPGSLFVAIRGATADGHDHAAAAVVGGASALAVERELDLGVPQLVVADTRAALGPLAATVYGHPADRMNVVGVTGTNGKTTVTHMIEAIANAAGLTSAIVGTVGNRIAGSSLPAERTTPEADDLQRLLARMVESGVDLAAIEVSSHALELGRVNGMRFAIAGFTNLSQDHLDFHGDMETYFEAKRRLFTSERTDSAVVCIDGEWGRRLAAELDIPSHTVSTLLAADGFVSDVSGDLDGSRFTLHYGGDEAAIRLVLPGVFNIANALVAAACALESGVSLDAVVGGLEALDSVPGRFEPVPTGHGFSVVVDYAHTPDAVAAVIEQARRIAAGRIITVVGAGGDRDRDKRPLMGSAASRSDVAVFTSDNPRSEDPSAILAAVVAGADGGAEIVTEVDRRSAIRRALGTARPGDVVLVLGKGHERGQEVAGAVLPFDDRQVVREELEAATATEEVTR